MHGLPSWLGFIIQYWAIVLLFSIITIIYLICTVIFYFKWKNIKLAISWPLFIFPEK